MVRFALSFRHWQLDLTSPPPSHVRMKHPFCRHIGWLAVVPILVAVTSVHGEIVNHLPPVADTTLRENQPNDNFGVAMSLPVGVSANGTPRNRGLFRFDLSRVPADAVFNSIKLRFTVTQAGPTSPPTVFELRRVLVDWQEGGKPGLAATFGEATWVARSNQEFAWAIGGGLVGTDFAPSASGSAVFGNAGHVAEFSSAGIAADVDLWRTNGAPNFGWMLLAQGEPAGSGKQVGSRENTTARPVLELRYWSFSIYDFARIGNALRFSFDVSSNQTYSVEYRDSVNSGPWTTLTNVPALPADSTIHVTNQIAASRRFYRLRKP